MLPVNLVKRSGDIIDMHKPTTRNEAAVVDGSTTKHKVKRRTIVCSIFHISREMSEIERRSLK